MHKEISRKEHKVFALLEPSIKSQTIMN